ncbi:MAG: Holliday junction branch migration protein RuvA [Bacteroidales bacterium]|nr:Holliday junction branch migration protein RuvA [Bacteroidales bacterium]
MIEYVTGRLVELTPTNAVIETAGGVAYNLAITLYDYGELQGKDSAKLLVHESIREDTWVLYGFVNDRERSLFRDLIGVSGVGAGSARVLLSSIPVAELEQVIALGDEKRLKNVKGIGQKTAQRIIVDLKGKIKLGEDTLIEETMPASQSYEEALAALVMLGFQKQASQKVLKKLYDADPLLKVEKAIKSALAML